MVNSSLTNSEAKMELAHVASVGTGIAQAPLIGQKPLRVLALIEANSISGTAKPVLEMAHEAKLDRSLERPLVLSVGCFFRGNGHPVGNALTAALEAEQVPVSFILEKRRFDPSVVPQIRSLLRNLKIDVVWTNSIKSHFLVHRARVREQCAWVAFHHGYTSTDFKMLLYNQFDRISLRHADRVLTVCRPLAEELKARGVEHDRIHVQHIPIRPFKTKPEDATALRRELSIHPDAKIILNVGRLSYEKAQADLITAFAGLLERDGHERLHLVLVGEGPERERLKQRARQLGVDERVTFAGHRDDVHRFYGIACAFALPSYAEGTPNVMLESMAADVPVVATSVGGVPELATHGRTALLVPPARPLALASALQRLLDSPALRHQLTVAARAVVASHPPQLFFRNMREIFVAEASSWNKSSL